jgi:hypothetical protein
MDFFQQRREIRQLSAIGEHGQLLLAAEYDVQLGLCGPLCVRVKHHGQQEDVQDGRSLEQNESWCVAQYKVHGPCRHRRRR